MGLEKYNIAPDDKGGRPEKEEEEGDLAQEPMGERPLTLDNDNEEYWQEMYDEYETIEQIAHNASVLATTAKRKLDDHGIADYEVDVPEPVESDKSSGGSIDEGSPSSGFAAIVNDAK